MDSNIRTKLYRHLGVPTLYLITGMMLIAGNIQPSLGIFFYAGILITSFLTIKGYITRVGLYSLSAPYFLMLGFGIWSCIFPYYIGVFLAILLGELFGRILYKALIKWKGTRIHFLIVPIFFFLFDFAFQNIPVLRDVHMIPLLSPIATHYVAIRGASIIGGHLVLAAITLILSCLMKFLIDSKPTKILFIVMMACGLLLVVPNIFDLQISKDGVYNDRKVRVSAVQGNYKQPSVNMQYEDYIADKLEYYMDLTSEGVADITVFPETELGIYDTSNKIDKEYKGRLIDASKRLGGISVFTVTEGNSNTKRKDERFISALLMEDGIIKGISRKRNLVPFKETRIYSKGKEYEVYETGFGRIGISICYDINDNTIKKLKMNGAEIILAPFNDSGFGSVYHNIHRYYPIIKAVEYGVPIVVANEDGISQIIDDNGYIHGELGYGHIGRLDSLITLKRSSTLYMLIGKYVEWLIFIGLILLILLKKYNKAFCVLYKRILLLTKKQKEHDTP